MAPQQQSHRRANWFQLLVLCLSCSIAISQTVGDDSSDAGSNNNSASSPSTTSSATTTPATSVPVTTSQPSTTAPTISPTTETPTTTTNTPTASTVSSSSSASETSAPTPTTKTPATTSSPTSTKTAAPSTSSTTAPSAAVDTDTSSSTSATAAPVVKQYNSSTLPPGVSSSVLNGSDLINVEVTETTLGNGSTSFDYVIVTSSGETEKVIVLRPDTTDPTSNNSEDASDQSGSSLSDNNTSTSSGSLGLGAVIGTIIGALVLPLALTVLLITRRRQKNQSNDESSNALAEIEKQMQLLDREQSQIDTEYDESTRTLGYSQVSGPLSGSRRYRGTLWEHPVIVASRIPIEHIELGETISRGAFGLVYRGRFRDQTVAIKTLLPEKRKDMGHIRVFLSEVKLMATMEHPNIVRFIGVAWESLSELYCVSEFMSGGDLRSLLQNYLATGAPQGMNPSKIQIAYDVSYALTYLHSLEPVVLHRDLKSRNILLTESLTAKITDFGTSRIRSDGSMTSNVGSSLWMAPEVMMGRRYDEKADVFSLGVVISELDTHELPYSHVKSSNNKKGHPLPDTAVLQMVSMGKLHVRFSPFMDQDIRHFVERCVNVSPCERPTAAEVLYYLQVLIRDRLY
ncbi:TKL protein kinase [Phytophthora nicotianae P1569]|uniref:TKL protein kinase n=2 Tax=Phytophthora nicotianae P1569 TaxID=1317065 RepID=V9EM62_PHYNI|nr:TKL protein kinase [Phytophthora nicotianae P1569]